MRARAIIVAVLLGIAASLTSGCGDDRSGQGTPDAATPSLDAGVPDAPEPDGPTSCGADEDCDDFNPCTEDRCVGGACFYAPWREGEPCRDGFDCTDPDHCEGGVCVGSPRDCSYLSDFCHIGVCDEDVGGCVASPLPDGTTCDDGLQCTVGDACQTGACVGMPRDCSAVEDDCNDSACDEALGCVPVPKANGLPCQDGRDCTTGDACQDGACVGGPPPACDDADSCTLDACDPDVDACVHEALPPIPGAEGPKGDATCGDGIDNDCDGVRDLSDPDCVDCVAAADCDDGNACTADDCAVGTCVNTPLDGVACSDGLQCTSGDVCQGGACVGGSPVSCDDGDACTVDACQEGAPLCLHASRKIHPDSRVSTSAAADGTPLDVCLTAGSDARVVVYAQLVDTAGTPLSGATVTIGGVAATESSAAPGTYYRVVTAAPAPGSESLAVTAAACGDVATLSTRVSITHAAPNATAGGTGGCSPPDGNLRVRVVEAETGAPIAGARVLVGSAEGAPFQTAPEWLFGGAGATGANTATTDGAGYARFFDYGSALGVQVTVTAGADGRAYFTIVDASSADVVLPLPLLHPPPVPTTTYDLGTGTASVSDCNDLDMGLLLPKLDLSFFSSLDLTRFFAKDRCWDSGAGGVTALPENFWVPSQKVSFACLGQIREATWTLRLKNTSATGVTENVSMAHVRIPLSVLQAYSAGSATLMDLLSATTYRGAGWMLNETVPTSPTSGRSVAANEDYPSSSTFTVTYGGRPTDTDVVGFTLGDYAGQNGTGPLFLLGHKVHEWDVAGSSVAIPNSDLNASGAPAGVRRLASVSALYLEPSAHPTIPANRLNGVSTVLLRGSGASPPFGASGGSATVSDFLDIVGTTHVAPREFRWQNATRNGNAPMYSRHELTLRTRAYLPVLPCATENDVVTQHSTQWIVVRPFGPTCGGEECFALPELPTGWPRAGAGVQKRDGFERVVGSGKACTGAGDCVSGESCVDPDGSGPASRMCMGGTGTAADPYSLQDYVWRVHVYDLGLASGWDFDAFDLASHTAVVTHESMNWQSLGP